MDTISVTLIIVGGLTLGIGICSVLLERASVSAPLIALFVGFVASPHVLGWVDPATWVADEQVLLEEAARFTLAIGLMGVALRIPAASIRRRWKSLSILLLVAMPMSMLITGGLTMALLQQPLLPALLIGAIAAPTDPVVASSIVTGRMAESHLPLRLRRIISAESGLNDGLAFPLVWLPILLVNHYSNVMEHWLTRTLFWEVGGAILVGWILGTLAASGLRRAEDRHTIENTGLLGFTLALTLLTLGTAKWLQTDDVLAVFFAGIAFDAGSTRSDRLKEERIQETVNQFFVLPIFALLGTVLPIDQWLHHGPKLILWAILILLLRRLPLLLLCKSMLGPLRRPRDAIFAGWFGPIGVAAIFYAVLAVRETQQPVVWSLVSLLIVVSVVAHGVTASPAIRRYKQSGT
ncbi:Cation/H+ exchanger [Rhodopirellula maiorica SM1]|uniref:Cation/H+ exchanger n=1 Tax=Rhodopirellula maiorica SM1 TaxID=1265738 RepID=M5S231_9BACT|nr:cation:proton antiporter [Rhodopirellula maiorica]EMI20234.1 Cation/H+ exchanger [Rhodopirellula maiorica SM1]